jgi:hypothetical protein
MRSRTKQEIMRGYAKLRDDKARRRRLPFKILAAVVLLGGGGKLFMVYRTQLAAAAASLSGAVRRWSDDMRDPKNYSSAPAPEPAPAPPAAPGAPVPPEGALRAQLFPAEGATPRPPGPSGSRPGARPAARPAARTGKVRAAPRPPAKNAWRVSGGVYDLSTLAPVKGAVITFLRDGKEPSSATTDETGTYEADLAKNDGWTASVKAVIRRPGYEMNLPYRGALPDIDPPYRMRDADERRATFEHISDEDLLPAPVAGKRTSSTIKLDLVVVPQHWVDGDTPR